MAHPTFGRVASAFRRGIRFPFFFFSRTPPQWREHYSLGSIFLFSPLMSKNNCFLLKDKTYFFSNPRFLTRRFGTRRAFFWVFSLQAFPRTQNNMLQRIRACCLRRPLSSSLLFRSTALLPEEKLGHLSLLLILDLRRWHEGSVVRGPDAASSLSLFPFLFFSPFLF